MLRKTDWMKMNEFKRDSEWMNLNAILNLKLIFAALNLAKNLSENWMKILDLFLTPSEKEKSDYKWVWHVNFLATATIHYI